MKKLNLILNILAKFIYAFTLFISMFFVYKIINLNVIPTKYLAIILPIYLIVIIILGIFIFIRRNITKIIGTIFSIILAIFTLFLNNYIVHTDKFIDNIKEKDYILKSYYVVALSKNKYKSLDSFNSLGIYDKDDDYKTALSQITNEFDLKLNKYETFEDTSSALFEKVEDIILLDSTDRGLLIDTIKEFSSKTTILSTIYVKKSNNIVDIEYEVTEKPFNILISGIDVKGDIQTVSRSDVNMIVTVNPSTHELLLTSIPRDYYVDLYGKNSKDKLTHAGVLGINTSIKTIENLLDIDIKYYLKVNFSTLIDVVDIIGGIKVTSDKTFTTRIDKNCNIKEGINYLDGKCALAYSRERYAYIEGDNHRILNQQDVLIAILNKTLTSKELLNKYFDVLEVLGKSFQTNMPKEKIYQLINMQLNSMKSWKIDTYSLNGTGSYEYTYFYKNRKLYVMKPNLNSINEARKKINELLSK